MTLFRRILLGMIILASSAAMFSLEVYNPGGEMVSYDWDALRQHQLEDFETHRERNEVIVTDSWQGINLQKWLQENKHTAFKSLRFESTDNYMVRISRAEYDSLRGYIALKRDGKWLESRDIRVIFPDLREMYWIRKVDKILLEEYKPAPSPQQIYVWDAVKLKLELKTKTIYQQEVSGYLFEDVLKDFLQAVEGPIVLYARDGLKNNLDYPQHLKDALLEVGEDGSLNLRSPVLPAGMWLRDIVYLQCGSVAVIRYDFIYMLPALYNALGWSDKTPADTVFRVSDQREEVLLEKLYLPDAQPFTTDEWLELP